MLPHTENPEARRIRAHEDMLDKVRDEIGFVYCPHCEIIHIATELPSCFEAAIKDAYDDGFADGHQENML